MKLRNLMYATMIAGAFASCSNDDVPTPDNGNPDVEGGTSLALKIDQPTTKAGAPTDILRKDFLVLRALQSGYQTHIPSAH